MLKENYINKFKDLPESLRQSIGLIIVTLVVILSFSILNGIFGQGDELVEKMKLEEERIAEEKKLSALISKLPSGILVSFDGTDHYKLTDEVYEQVCKVTKLIPQRAIMGANFLNFRAHELYTINGNKIDETFVKWDHSNLTTSIRASLLWRSLTSRVLEEAELALTPIIVPSMVSAFPRTLTFGMERTGATTCPTR